MSRIENIRSILSFESKGVAFLFFPLDIFALGEGLKEGAAERRQMRRDLGSRFQRILQI